MVAFRLKKCTQPEGQRSCLHFLIKFSSDAVAKIASCLSEI